MRMPRNVFESVVSHARESLPRECCGILMARVDDPSTVTMAIRAENAESDSPEQEYVLGHKAHLAAVDMESSGAVRIIGYYHSHPQGGNRPSARDKVRAIAGTTYLVLGLGCDAVEYAAWRFEGDAFAPEPLEVGE